MTTTALNNDNRRWTLYRADTQQRYRGGVLRDVVLLFLLQGDQTHVLAVDDYYDNIYFPALPGVSADEFGRRLWHGMQQVHRQTPLQQQLKVPRQSLNSLKPYLKPLRKHAVSSDDDEDDDLVESRSPLVDAKLVSRRNAWRFRPREDEFYQLSWDCSTITELASLLLVNPLFLEQFICQCDDETKFVRQLQLDNDLHTYYNQQCVPLHTKFLIDHNLALQMTTCTDPATFRKIDDIETLFASCRGVSCAGLPPFEASMQQDFGVTMFWDIECMNDGGFPSSERDPIICISAAFYRHTELLPPLLVFTNGQVPRDPAVEKFMGVAPDHIRYFEEPDERRMLQRFVAVWRQMQPNNICGFNILQFDLPYALDRMRLHGVEALVNGIDSCPLHCKKIPILSQQPNAAAKRQSKTQQLRRNLDTNKRKHDSDPDDDEDDDDGEDGQETRRERDKCNYVYNTVGVNIVDLLVIYQKFKSTLPMFSLDYITRQLLPPDKQKLDLVEAAEKILTLAGSSEPRQFADRQAHELITLLWPHDDKFRTTPQIPCRMRQLIAYYNVLDSVACAELAFATRDAFFSLCVALSSITNLNLECVVMTGQQRKIVTVLESFCRRHNMVLPFFRKDPELLRQLRQQPKQGDDERLPGQTRFKNLLADVEKAGVTRLLVQKDFGSFGAVPQQGQRALEKLEQFVRNNAQYRQQLNRLRSEQRLEQFTKECHDEMTTASKKNKKGYDGAFVFDAMTGYYDDPTITLDFQSLYPSIMRAHNLCYSTMLRSVAEAERLGVRYEVTKSGDVFVTQDVMVGLLPQQLTEGFNKRLEYKRAGFKAGDEATKAYINSVYGGTGDDKYVTAKLPMIEIARSVTSYGQYYIKLTKDVVEQEGLAIIQDARVLRLEIIYGDTDSVFIRVVMQEPHKKLVAREDVERWGKQLAAAVTSRLPAPMKLVFEKFLNPMVLISKKKYFGTSYVEGQPPSQCCKGMASKVRTYCRYVNQTCQQMERLVVSDAFHSADGDRRQAMIEQLLAQSMERLLRMCDAPGDADIDMLLITKKYDSQRSYNSAKMPHLEVVRKRRKANPMDIPHNERISFVFLRPANMELKYQTATNFYTAAEDTALVRKRLRTGDPVRLFFNFYANNQLAGALEKQIVPIFMTSERYDSVMKGVFRRLARGADTSNTLYAYFNK